jgi:DNA mismatch repair protein MutL
MSDIIQLLPDSVANQIAAGEVIQRPASVIKELVENAVDAGARHIRVIIIDAGRTSIQVIDDGCGMSETDARLAFERHATSKIRQADDLFALHTMGFRGEALPSIAAVAQVELTTRMEGDDIGTRLTLQGSRVVSQEPVACPVGSSFKVENLFFNVPARRKFLKTNATELNNILTAFERIVLVYPDMAFTLYSNGQELLNLRPGSLRQRLSDVFGKKLSQELLPVEVDTTLCRVTGFVGKPEAAKKKGAATYFFVNGRYMRHPYFHKAVSGAYERLVPEGMQVPYFIYFDVPPTDIDVNIHPTKTEIKFENEQAIWQILSAAVKDAIGKFCEIPTINFDTEGRPDIPVFDPQRDNIEAPRVQYNPSYNPFLSGKGGASGTSGDCSYWPQQSQRSNPSQDWQQLYESALGRSGQSVQQQDFFTPDDAAAVPCASPQAPAPAGTLISEKSPIHYQYKGRYIMTAVKSGLMIIDQHRADVRIRYERIMEQLRQQTVSTQRVLFPEVIEFSAADNVMMQRLLPDLSVMGFEISDLGGGSYAVNGVPAGTEDMSPVVLVRNIVADADLAADAIPATMALSMARHTAIPQGQVLSNEEMERIVNELFACSNVNYTPDGHTIIAILPQHDIEQLLG